MITMEITNMVKTRNPLSSEEASGSVGRTTYKRWGQIQTAARKSQGPGNQNTPRQQVVRAVWADLSTRWQALSAADANAWRVYAEANPVTNRLGQEYVLTPFDMFCACSRTLVEQTGGAPPSPIAINDGVRIHYTNWSQLGPGALSTTVYTVPGGRLPVVMEVWTQGPLANALRALRQPEQRIHEILLQVSAPYTASGLESGAWYYLGIRGCWAGALPGPVQWAGPFQTM